MLMTENSCPNCHSPSDKCIRVIIKAAHPKDEGIYCDVCGWAGRWKECIKVEVDKDE